MRFPVRKALRYAARLARSRLVRHGLILGYHRINRLSWDPFRLAVSPDAFAQQLEILHRYANVMPLHELAEARASGSIPPRSVAITFDDGYADYLHVARPLLDQAGFHSTLFMSTGYIGREFWWDILARLVDMLDPAIPLSVSAEGVKFDWRPEAYRSGPDRKTLAMELSGLLLPMDKDIRLQFLQRLMETAGLSLPENSGNQALSARELGELSKLDLVSIGSHTVSHPMLARLRDDQQRTEIAASKQALENLTGKTVSGFSFPHGSTSAASIRFVEECGYRYACASHNDVVWRNSNPFCLPRIWIPDCPGNKFLRLLRRWL
jgi:peptidoglycan/xylan/chitin deacetylase (PgdA/CDA1 family)